MSEMIHVAHWVNQEELEKLDIKGYVCALQVKKADGKPPTKEQIGKVTEAFWSLAATEYDYNECGFRKFWRVDSGNSGEVS